MIIIVTNKFGKISGPGAQATPADNSVTTGKVLDGTLLAADIADYATLIAGTNATSALAAVAGILKVSFGSVTAKTAPVVGDIVLIADSEASSINKAVTLTNLAKPLGEVMAGTAASSALTEVDGVMTVRPLGATAKAIPAAGDGFLLGDSAASGAPKTVTFAELGTAQSGSGLASVDGVQAVSGVGIAHCLNDDPHSIFFVTAEVDYGASTVISQDLGALGAKATLVGGYWASSEAMVGSDATTVVTVGSATGGGTPIATAITITTANTADGQSNKVGSMGAILPVAAGIDMASTDHVWVDIPDDVAGDRSAGKIIVFLIFQKSA